MVEGSFEVRFGETRKEFQGIFAMLFPNHYLEVLVRYAICRSSGVFLPEVGGGQSVIGWDVTMTSVTCTNSAGLCQRAVGRFNTVL